MKKLFLLSIIASATLMAGGYKIPETSLNSVALSSANVAHSSGADTAYYNPANMAFMKNESIIETDLIYIGLSDTNYKGTLSGTGPYDLSAKKEHFLVPSLNYVSEEISGLRFGLSMASPYGLSKRWTEEPAKTSTEEFTLITVEINPTVAMSLSDKLAVALGLRIVYAEGIVKSNGTAFLNPPGAFAVVSRDMDGDTIELGYNIAIAYKPTPELELGLTYRSEVDLDIEGDAKLAESLTSSTYSGGTSISVPLPASLNLAVAYTFASKTTVEIVYEKSFWSAYKELDFNYSGTLSPVLSGVFDRTIDKNWKDAQALRLGITQELDELTLMCGIVIDETPIPTSTLGFELPGSDAVAVSFGGRYQINKKMNIGLSTLYVVRDDVKLLATSNDNGLSGEFTDTSALLISAGLEYKF